MDYRELIKCASQQRKSKDIQGAIDTLNLAFRIRNTSTDLYSIQDDLKLPMYMLENGAFTEAETLIFNLANNHLEPYNQVAIYEQISIFYKKAKQVDSACLYRSLAYVLKVVNKIEIVRQMQEIADDPEHISILNSMPYLKERSSFYTLKGNVIADVSYPFLLNDIDDLSKTQSIASYLRTYIKKTKFEPFEAKLVELIVQCIQERLFDPEAFKERFSNLSRLLNI